MYYVCKFTTGTAVLPVGGFANLQGSTGTLRKFELMSAASSIPKVCQVFHDSFLLLMNVFFVNLEWTPWFAFIISLSFHLYAESSFDRCTYMFQSARASRVFERGNYGKV